jgi:hypothetical protein
MNKVNKNVAAAEVDNFLFKVKKINKKELLGGNYGQYAMEDYLRFVGDVSAGYFVFKEDKVIQSLDFSVSKDSQKEQNELAYKPRLFARELSRLAAYNLNDIEGRKREIIAILTDEAAGIIGEMDSGDYERAKRLIDFYFLG